MLRLALAWLHLLALGIGLGAVWTRGRSAAHLSRDTSDVRARAATLVADNWWGIAAALWLATGLWRLFGSVEKSSAYYMSNHVFYAKMALFILVLVIEVWPMITLIRWRIGRLQPTSRTASRIAAISHVEACLVVVIVLAAVSMARGYGAR